MSLDWQLAMAGPGGEGAARQPGAPSRRAARPAAGEGAARRRADRGRAPHVQPRDAGGARLQHRSRARSTARALPPWRPADAAGASGVRVFIRRSGAPLTEGVPGFYTIDGFYKVLLPNLPAATMQVASESWVLGKDAQIDPASPQVLTLQRDVIALYTADYARQWDAPAGRSRHRADAQPAAGGAGSVHPRLAAVADARPAGRHHAPAHADPAAATAAWPRRCRPGRGAGGDRGGVAGGEQRRPARLQGAARSGQRAAAGTAGQGDRGSLRRADRLRRQGTGRTDRQRAEAAERPAGAARQAGRRAGGRCGGARRRRRPRADRCRPRPAAIRSRWRAGCRRWRSAATSCAAAARSIRRRRRSARRAARPRCAARRSPAATRSPPARPTTSRWTISPAVRDRRTARQVLQREPADLRRYLRRRPGRRSRWPASRRRLRRRDLAQFQRASQIRDLFFAGGGNQPTVRFDITPMDTDAKQVTLDLDGLSIVYAHGPIRATSVTWPGQNRMNSVRLVFDPPPSSGQPVLQATGPWALFRLFGQGTLQQSDAADRYTLNFTARRPPRLLRDARRFGAEPVRARRAARLPVPGDVTAGFYGKLPARGDFVRAGLPRDFTDPWDDWLQSVIAGSRSLMGDAWLPAFLEAPVWRFTLPRRHVRDTGGARPDAAERGSGRPLLSPDLCSTQRTRHRQRRRARPGSTRARRLDAPRWNRIRRHRRLPTRLGRPSCRMRHDRHCRCNMVERRFHARRTRLPDSAVSARCGDLCSHAGRGRTECTDHRLRGVPAGETKWESTS